MIAQELEVSLHMAFVEARQKRHEFITVEHLLLALLDNPSAAEVLRACGANTDDTAQGSDAIHRTSTRRPFPARTTSTRSRRWASSASFSAPSCTSSLPARRKSTAPTCWSPSSAKRIRTRSISCRSRASPASTSSISFRTASPRCRSPRTAHGRRNRDRRRKRPKPGPLEQYTINLNAQALHGQDRSADRPRQGTGARHPDPVPPAQEQPAAGRRSRRRQDRHRRRPGRRIVEGEVPEILAKPTSTRWTWVRCWPAPSIAATSSSA
jgi:ATP-dependent Clp protease ATP-binding subunit ClpA